MTYLEDVQSGLTIIDPHHCLVDVQRKPSLSPEKEATSRCTGGVKRVIILYITAVYTAQALGIQDTVQ